MVSIKKYSSLTKYAIQFIKDFLGAMLLVNSINLMKIATVMAKDTKKESEYRKIQRFLSKKKDLSGIGIFCLERYIKEALKASPKRPYEFYLLIDRVEWGLGQKVHNNLFVSLYDPSRDVNFPVQVKDLGSKGNSSTENRKEVMEKVVKLLRPMVETGEIKVTVLGDREFIGESWEEYLGLNHMDYILRLRRNYRLPDGRVLGDEFEGLGIGMVREYRFDGWRVIMKRLKGCKGRRDDFLAVVTLDMELSSEEVLARFRKRWNIERAFFNLNTNGFEMKRTRLKDESKLEMVTYFLIFNYFVYVILGSMIEEEEGVKRQPDKHGGYRRESQFIKGLRFVFEILRWPQKLLKNQELLKRFDFNMFKILNIFPKWLTLELLPGGVV